MALRMVIEGYDSVLPACEPHANRLDAYAAEDAQVRIVDISSDVFPGAT